MKKVLLIGAALMSIVLLIAAWYGYSYYNMIFGPNVPVAEDYYRIQISSDATYTDVYHKLIDQGIIIDSSSFDWVAQQMNYPSHVYSGYYVIPAGLNNRQLVGLLRSGDQTPIRIVLNKHRTKEELCSFVASKLEADSATLYSLLMNDAFLSEYNLNVYNVMGIFIPNTYEFFWNTDARGFFERMHKEFNRFWNDSRKQMAQAQNLTPLEVMSLASIVEEESIGPQDRKMIAGVYLNRLQDGWKLQADPTVRFAHQDFTIRRLLFSHLAIESPYNTYKYEGLPPGPICIPSIQSIDAVLQPATHDYMYFCAKTDNSGSHHYSRTYAEHLQYARDYQAQLNRDNIYK